MKIRRIIALITVVFLAGIYIVTIIAALSSSPTAGDWFKACIFLSVVLPILLYGMLLIGKYSASRHDLPEDEDFPEGDLPEDQNGNSSGHDLPEDSE